MPGETVLECLARRSELLTNATLDDNYLEDMVAGLDVLSNLSTKQKEKLRIQYLHLKQAYVLAIQ